MTIPGVNRSTPHTPTAVRLLHVLLICSLVFLVFGQTVTFDFLEWDDNEYVRDNPRVLAGLTTSSLVWALTSFSEANWHPLTWWSYLLDISLFGPKAGALHLVNVALHAVNSALVYLLFVRLGLRPLLALLAAAVFAVHPLHVESVAWIAERKDLLSAFFLLALLLVWDRYARTGRRRDYGLALLLAALGLMAKAMLVTLPCLLLLLDAWPYARLRTPGQHWWRDRLLLKRCIEKLPFLALALGCAWLTLLAQSAGGAIRPLEQVSLADRLMNALVSYAAYLGQMVVPVSQSFLYVFRPPAPLSAFASLALLGLITWWAMKQKGAARAGWLWFLVTLLPVIGLIKLGDHARADRYMYLPMIGLLLMLASATLPVRVLARIGVSGRRLLLAAGVALVLALALSAYRYTGYWRNSETLFQHGLAVDPENHVAHTLLAATYEYRGQPQATFSHAEAALRLAPNSVAAASAAISASNAALMLGDEALARRYLERAIAAAPALAKPHYNLGTQWLRLGEPAAALAHFERAIALDSRSSENYNNYGVALLQLGRRTQASAAFATALRNEPDNRQARQNLQRSQQLRLP
jgi:Tfp pilus assembly protein PilF